MSIMIKHPAVRWLAPVAVVAVVGGGAVIGHAVASGTATASLPTVTPAELIADIRNADVAGVSGTVVETADLGLPSLPGLGSALGTSNSGLLGMITGTHTLRVWYGGPTKQRIALLGSMGESDIIRNGQDLWTWDSSDNSATHRTLPAGAKGSLPGGVPSTAIPVDPQQAAQTALSEIDATTTVTVDNSVTVAGRAAYELVLSPKESGTSLISAVRIAVDGKTYVPLRVQVDSVNTKTPAFSVGFTSVDFGTPDAAEFSFTPPPGVTVDSGGQAGLGGMLDGLPQLTKPAVVGTGWSSVVVADIASGATTRAGKPGHAATDGCATASSGPAASGPSTPQASGTAAPPAGDDPQSSCVAIDGTAGGGTLARIAQSLPKVSGAWGSGRILAGTLFTVVITDDHRVAIGAVTPDVVYAALEHR